MGTELIISTGHPKSRRWPCKCILHCNFLFYLDFRVFLSLYVLFSYANNSFLLAYVSISLMAEIKYSV
jgi:hypothetical protein